MNFHADVSQRLRAKEAQQLATCVAIVDYAWKAMHDPTLDVDLGGVNRQSTQFGRLPQFDLLIS